MPNRVIRPDANDTTRDRILKAAILRFSTHSYDHTGLRDIAADVGVDMAYVHRSFGSKEKLFYEAVKASDLAPKFYPVLSSLQRFLVAVFAAVAAGCGAEPFRLRSTASRRGLII